MSGSDPLEDEPNGSTGRDKSDYDDVISKSLEDLSAPVLSQPTHMNALTSSRTLGLEDLNALMGLRYVNVVGILGDPESGKTACLASLYLLISHAKLDGWTFADSRSLTAFEDIARGARDWNQGQVPEQMTVHTELSDDHRPGFLHLRLKRVSDGRLVDFALPDIPGEWTQALVTSAISERLEYMKSAEVIWIVVDGRSLADIEKRQGLIVRIGQLAGRLQTMFEGQIPRLIIVVTHHDTHVIGSDVSGRLSNELQRRGTHAEIISVAPFSNHPGDVKAGHGLAELIDSTVGKTLERPIFWESTELVENERSYLSYRRNL